MWKSEIIEKLVLCMLWEMVDYGKKNWSEWVYNIYNSYGGGDILREMYYLLVIVFECFKYFINVVRGVGI